MAQQQDQQRDHGPYKGGAQDRPASQQQGGQQAQPDPRQQAGTQQAFTEQQKQEDVQKQVQERHDAARKAYDQHEKENNPKTADLRQYDKNAPGMHPANQPAADTRLQKGTRLDLEDVTGNPGHRGVNPDAPATSMNRDNDMTASVNEPPGTEPQNQRASVRTGSGSAPLAGQGVQGSPNEPPGSSLGGNMNAQGQPITGGDPSQQPLVINSLDPDEATIGEETFDMFVHGTGFTEDCVIVFAGQDEPTDLEDDGSLSTGINMDVWNGPDTVKVSVKRGSETSNEMDFTFHAEAAARKKPPAPVKRKGKGVKAKKGKR